MQRSEMYQAVSRRILTVEVQVRSQAIEKGVCAGRMVLHFFPKFSFRRYSMFPIYQPWAIGRSSDTL